VLLDGRPLRDYPLQTLRANIGFVPQETFLFSETLRENIAFGVPAASDEEVFAPPKPLTSAKRIRRVPQRISDHGRGARRHALRRTKAALRHCPRGVARPSVLILDDALASVDTYTEEQILNELRRIMQGRTTIFISHRISTVRHADRIAVLMKGASSNMAPTNNFWRATATMRGSSRSSCSRKSWRSAT
jgi:ATP-binding cassette subfamily B multidrug efflux pump